MLRVVLQSGSKFFARLFKPVLVQEHLSKAISAIPSRFRADLTPLRNLTALIGLNFFKSIPFNRVTPVRSLWIACLIFKPQDRETTNRPGGRADGSAALTILVTGAEFPHARPGKNDARATAKRTICIFTHLSHWSSQPMTVSCQRMEFAG